MFESFVCFTRTDQILFYKIFYGRWINEKCLKIAGKETNSLENVLKKIKKYKNKKQLISN